MPPPRRRSGRRPIPRCTRRMKDPTEPFRFSFPDLSGKLVSNTDRQFAGKVVLVNISGSWCPNCHDEAPFLASLYRKYRAKGLEIVTLSFEEPDQLANPDSFARVHRNLRHRVHRPRAGRTGPARGEGPAGCQPQLLSDDVLHRARRSRSRGACRLPEPGSGEFYLKAERDITEQVERLLAERAGTR